MSDVQNYDTFKKSHLSTNHPAILLLRDIEEQYRHIARLFFQIGEIVTHMRDEDEFMAFNMFESKEFPPLDQKDLMSIKNIADDLIKRINSVEYSIKKLKEINLENCDMNSIERLVRTIINYIIPVKDQILNQSTWFNAEQKNGTEYRRMQDAAKEFYESMKQFIFIATEKQLNIFFPEIFDDGKILSIKGL